MGVTPVSVVDSAYEGPLAYVPLKMSCGRKKELGQLASDQLVAPVALYAGNAMFSEASFVYARSVAALDARR